MTNPILLLPYAPSELTRKPGGGQTPAPFVEVTRGLREEHARALDALSEVAASIRATPRNPLPVKVTLRRKALAKSNRPYRFLQAAALPPVAADNAGELIVEGTSDRLRNLASSIRTATSKVDVFQISTFADFSGWDTVADAFGVPDEEVAEQLLNEARESGKFVRLTFFPWVATHMSRLTMTQGVVSGGDGPSSPNTSIAIYSQMLGLDVRLATVSRERPVVYVAPSTALTVEHLDEIRGLRSVSVAPEYEAIAPAPQSFLPIRSLDPDELALPDRNAPMVGVLDSGIDGDALQPAVVGQVDFDSPLYRDPAHGTFVAGLIVTPRSLNPDDDFPNDGSLVFDGQVLPNRPLSEALLLERIIDTVESAPEIKVWNCSFGAVVGPPPEYGAFAQELDAISDEKGVLFVQAAGNYEAVPRRAWPPVDLEDGLASPAEAIRSLTVGARAHKGGAVPTGMPSSYSRRGPNFARHVKPELCHWAGDVGPTGELDGHGVKSLVPDGQIAEGIGTSFSTPVISTIAANVWAKLDEGGATTVRPELIRGLLVHAATLRDTTTEPPYRHYYGWGVPPASGDVLANDDASFTTVHEVVLTPGNDWYKRPFPVPGSLLTAEGKFKGEVILTISYAPPVNPAFGAEGVRYDVAGSFGHIAKGDDDKEHFHSITPQEVTGAAYWEVDQVADGKWSPIKTHRKRAPRGVAGGDWALRLSLTERVSEEVALEQRVFAIITFRATEPGLSVYQDGVQAVNQFRYASRNMIPSTTIRIEGRS